MADRDELREQVFGGEAELEEARIQRRRVTELLEGRPLPFHFRPALQQLLEEIEEICELRAGWLVGARNRLADAAAGGGSSHG